MKQITAYQCEGCGKLVANPEYHNEPECLQKKADEERSLREYEAKVDQARAECKRLGEQHSAVLVDAYETGLRRGWGHELVRDIAHDIYRDSDLPDFGCSGQMENMYTLIIKSAIPKYVFQ